MVNVILCGGSGTRLWPMSRKLLPKQFLKIFDNKSLFQKTVERNDKVCKKRYIVTNQDHYFLAYDQLEEINKNDSKFLLEGIGRNTAPAIALACFDLDEDDIVFVTPSDHLIKENEKYYEAINKARELAQKGNLVTFGIVPKSPETGYGYIEFEGVKVISFKEKPNLKTAEKYIKQENFLWNSGMFMFKAGVYLKELEKHSLEIYEASKSAYENRQIMADNQIKIPQNFMEKITEDSIDYAVMEKSKKINVVKSDFDWNDLGSFDSLINEIESDKAIEIDSKNNFIRSKRSVSLIDVDDLIVIDTPDALLISKKGSTQKVREVVKQVKNVNKELVEAHTKVHRPWGTFETLLEGQNYKIKKIMVKPGKRLSLQQHFHRSEHWIVVSGTAEVQVGEKKYLVRPNESTYINLGEIHRLYNPGKIPVVLIEVQVGEYTGEDDIIRIEDDFNR